MCMCARPPCPWPYLRDPRLHSRWHGNQASDTYSHKPTPACLHRHMGLLMAGCRDLPTSTGAREKPRRMSKVKCCHSLGVCPRSQEMVPRLLTGVRRWGGGRRSWTVTLSSSVHQPTAVIPSTRRVSSDGMGQGERHPGGHVVGQRVMALMTTAASMLREWHVSIKKKPLQLGHRNPPWDG